MHHADFCRLGEKTPLNLLEESGTVPDLIGRHSKSGKTPNPELLCGSEERGTVAGNPRKKNGGAKHILISPVALVIIGVFT